MDDAPPPPRTVAFQALLLLGGIGAYCSRLFVSVRAHLGPFWVAVAGGALLWPIRRHRAAQAVLWAGGLLFGAYVLSQLGGVLAPFIAVFVAGLPSRPGRGVGRAAVEGAAVGVDARSSRSPS